MEKEKIKFNTEEEAKAASIAIGKEKQRIGQLTNPDYVCTQWGIVEEEIVEVEEEIVEPVKTGMFTLPYTPLADELGIEYE